MTYKIISYCMAFVCASTFLGCATSPPKLQVPLISESEYYERVEQFTKKSQVYDGFYNTLELNATLLNSLVTRAQIDQSARIYQWDQTTYDIEKPKILASLKEKTRIFLSFFTPEKKHDDLAKPKTVWKIFLDVDGKRYEPKTTKEKKLVTEVQRYYPFHTRWNTPYLLEFDVPQEKIEKKSAQLTLTGPVGSTTIEFPPEIN